MDIPAAKLNPAPVLLEVKNWLGKVSTTLELLPFSLRVQIWANEHFATNAEGDNGLDRLDHRIKNFDRDAVCRLTHELLKDKESYPTVLDFKKKFQKSAQAIQAMYIALDQAFKKASPDIYNDQSTDEEVKKKA